MGFSFWAKQNSSAVQVAFVYSRNNRFFNFVFENQTSVKLNTTTQSVSTSVDLTVYNLFTFNIRQDGDSDIYVNGVKVATISETVLSVALPQNTILGIGRTGGTGRLDGNIEQFTVLKNRTYTELEIARTYNNGIGRKEPKYSPDNPTIKQNLPYTDDQLVSYGGYNLTESGDGSVGILLSKDNYTTKHYWDGVQWSIAGTSYNSVATVNSNISNFSAEEQQISTEIALISDGFQQVELLSEQINYAVNLAPTVNAGFDKPLGGQSAITTLDSFKPSSDGTAIDIDTPIAQILISPNGGDFENIEQGVYASLVEAWNNKQFNASNYSPGTYPFITKVIDTFGAESQDIVQVTIIDSNSNTLEGINTKVDQLLSLVDTLNKEISADEFIDPNGKITKKDSSGQVLSEFTTTRGTVFDNPQAWNSKVRIV
jgi:hypothetical protein